jgi:hypothetical protein
MIFVILIYQITGEKDFESEGAANSEMSYSRMYAKH